MSAKAEGNRKKAAPAAPDAGLPEGQALLSGAEAASGPETAPPEAPAAPDEARLREAGRRAAVIRFLYYAVILTLVYVAVKYVLGYIAPFAAGMVVAMVLQPAVRYVSRRLKMKNTAASVLVVALFYSTIGVLSVFGAIAVISKLVSFLPRIYYRFFNPNSPEYVVPIVTGWSKTINENIERIDPQIKSTVETAFNNLISSLVSMARNFTNTTVQSLASMLTSVSSLVVTLIFTVIATFFLSADYERIARFLTAQVSPRTAGIVQDVRRTLGEVIWQFLKSYSLIFLMTFAELAAGFALLGAFGLLDVPNLLVVALLISVLDIMPVLGLGAVLIPWGIISLLLGNRGAGIGLLIVYVITLVVRNIVEPKVVGKGVGLSAFVTLFSMYVGARLFGVLGLFGLPVAVVIIKSLNDKGAIRIYRNGGEASSRRR